MLKKWFHDRIQVPVNAINDLCHQLYQKHKNINLMYMQLKDLVGSEQSQIDLLHVDSVDILHNMYLSLQKNIDFVPRFKEIQNKVKMIDYFCSDFIDFKLLDLQFNKYTHYADNIHEHKVEQFNIK